MDGDVRQQLQVLVEVVPCLPLLVPAKEVKQQQFRSAVLYVQLPFFEAQIYYALIGLVEEVPLD